MAWFNYTSTSIKSIDSGQKKWYTGFKQKELKIRKGRDIEESTEIVALEIKTKCPSKWILIDTETGQSYKGNPGGYWDRLEPIIKDQ